MKNILIVSVILFCLGLATIGAGGQAFPIDFELSDLLETNGGDGSRGIVLHGAIAHASAGYAVSSAGDINNDGYDDVLIGSSSENTTYLVFGSSSYPDAEIDLADLYAVNGGDGETGVVLKGASSRSVDGRGDINGDQIDDIVIGASNVIYGANISFPPEIMLPLSNATVPRGTRLVSFADSIFANAKFAGDFNGDGIDDLLIGTPASDPGDVTSAGITYLIFGAPDLPDILFPQQLTSDGGNLGQRGIIFAGENAYDISGWSVSAAGDVNDDGLSDILVSARDANYGTIEYAGHVYLIYGDASSSRPERVLSDLLSQNGGDGSEGVMFYGAKTLTAAGVAVSGIGDFNADGKDDFIIGAESGGDGQVHIIKSPHGFSVEQSLNALMFTAVEESLLGLSFDGYYSLNYGTGVGYSVSSAGDVNNDGLNDILIGAPFSIFDSPGRTWLLFGEATGISVGLQNGLSDLLFENGGNGRFGIAINGLAGSNLSGFSVDSVGDFNGDNIDDFVIGAPSANALDRDNAGQAYIIFGTDTDLDDDGIYDVEDNCLNLSNPSQRDTDEDGYGNQCDGDFNNDCNVNFFDAFFLNENFLVSTSFGTDINGDNTTNFVDYYLFEQMFLDSVGPSGITDHCQ